MLAIIGLSINVNAQWNQQVSGTTNQLSGVYFLNKDTGYVAGGNTILKTENGGSSWQMSDSGNFSVQGISFANSTNGFAVGLDVSTDKSAIIKTTNGGISWTIIDFTTKPVLNDIYFVDSSNGYIVGSNGVAFKTTDGGNAWDTLNVGTSVILSSVFFTSSLNGIIVGGTPTSSLILRTTDGGNSWTTITSTATDFLQGVYFPSPSIGYIVGWGGEILKTTDSGLTWNAQTSVANYGNLSVFFVDDTTGYVVGGTSTFAGIQKTTDGGQTWYAQTSSVNEGLIGVFFPTKTTGYCVGNGGTILKTMNGGGTFVEEKQLFISAINIYPNPAINNITIVSSQEEAVIEITNIQGQLIKTFTTTSNKTNIDVSTFPSGVYVVAVKTKNGVSVSKVMKE